MYEVWILLLLSLVNKSLQVAPTVAVGAGTNTAYFYQVPSGTLVHTESGTNSGSYISEIINIDDNYMAAAATGNGAGCYIIIYCKANQSEMYRFNTGDNGVINRMKYISGGILITASSSQISQVWNLSNPTSPIRNFNGHTGAVKDVIQIIGYGSNLVATAGMDASVKVWDWTTGNLNQSFNPGNNNAYALVQLSANLIAVSDSSSKIRIAALNNNTISQPFANLYGYASSLILYSANWLVSADSGGCIRVWVWANMSEVFSPSGCSGNFAKLSLTSDGILLSVQPNENRIMYHNITSTGLVQLGNKTTPLTPYTLVAINEASSFISASTSSAKIDLVVSAANASVFYYNSDSLSLISSYTLPSTNVPCYVVQDAPFTNIFIGTSASKLHFFNKSSLSMLKFVVTGLENSITSVSFITNTIVLIGSLNNNVTLLNLTDNSTRYYREHNSSVSAVLLLQGQTNLVATGGADRTIRIWNWVTLQTMLIINTTYGITNLIQVSSTMLASNAANGFIHIWSIIDGSLLFSMRASTSRVDVIRLFNSSYLIAGDCSGYITIWSWVYGFPYIRLQTPASQCARAIDISTDFKVFMVTQDNKTVVARLNQTGTDSFTLTVLNSTTSPLNPWNIFSMNSYSSGLSSLSVTPTTVGLKSAYVYIGCYKDNSTIRDLNGTMVYLPSNNSVQMCYSYCSQMSFAYFGLQDGSQCFCGNRFGLYGVGSSCSAACSGSSSQTCGGAYQSSVYMILSYQYIGCYLDLASRDLSGFSVGSSSMTVEKCLAYCARYNYDYFALQAGYYCSCDNQYGSYGGSAVPCNNYCAGNSSQMCGGPATNGVYKITYSTQPNTQLVVNYMGCFNDLSTSRDLSYVQTNIGSTTLQSPSICVVRCSELNFTYSGTQGGSGCFCGNSYGSAGNTGASCNTDCAGVNQFKCGGTLTNTIFSTKEQINQNLLGCFVQGTVSTDHSFTSAYSLSIAICVTNCSNLGYKYAALFNGSTCICGNQLNINANSRTGAVCAKYCTGSKLAICGGTNSTTVFAIENPATTTSTTTSTTTTTNPACATTIAACGAGCSCHASNSQCGGCGPSTDGTSCSSNAQCVSYCKYGVSSNCYQASSACSTVTVSCGANCNCSNSNHQCGGCGPSADGASCTSATQCITYCKYGVNSNCSYTTTTSSTSTTSTTTTTTLLTTTTQASVTTTGSASTTRLNAPTSTCSGGYCTGGGGAQWGDYAPCANSSTCQYYSSYGYPFSCSNPYNCPSTCQCSGLSLCSGCGGAAFGDGVVCFSGSMCTSYCMYGVVSTCPITAAITTDIAAILSSLSSLASIDFSTLTTAQTLSILASGLDATNCLTNCSNQGACKVSNNTLVCQCSGNFTGPSCSSSLDPCYSNPCSNNGTCWTNTTDNGTYTFTCECAAPYYGSNCQLKVDLCVNVTCSGNGKCIDRGDYTECSCYYMYSGDDCQIVSTKKAEVQAVMSIASVIAIVSICLFYLTLLMLDLMNFYLWYKSGMSLKPKVIKRQRVKFTYKP